MMQSFEKLDAEDKGGSSMKRALAEIIPGAIHGENEPLDYTAFSEAFYDEESGDRFFQYVNELLRTNDFSAISRYSQILLIEAGVAEAEGLDHTDSTVALALAEAVNLAAKNINYRFYQLKPAMIVAAWKTGNHFGYNKEDGTYSLFNPSIGTASFHDPGEDIYGLITRVLTEEEPEWLHEWSGVARQDLAFDVLKSLKEMDDLIAELIRTTTPEPLKGDGIDFRSGKEDSLLEKYGKDSMQVKLRDIVLASEDKQVRALLERLKDLK